jgi:hypothetical protein
VGLKARGIGDSAVIREGEAHPGAVAVQGNAGNSLFHKEEGRKKDWYC